MSEVYRCPHCGKSSALWQALEVSAWQPINVDGEVDKHRREVDWSWVDELPDGGCGECGWDGALAAMRVTLGIDGLPLPEIHPRQMEIT